MFSKSTTKEEMIVELYQDQYTQDEICDRLQVGKHRVGRVIKLFKEAGTVL